MFSFVADDLEILIITKPIGRLGHTGCRHTWQRIVWRIRRCQQVIVVASIRRWCRSRSPHKVRPGHSGRLSCLARWFWWFWWTHRTLWHTTPREDRNLLLSDQKMDPLDWQQKHQGDIQAVQTGWANRRNTTNRPGHSRDVMNQFITDYLTSAYDQIKLNFTYLYLISKIDKLCTNHHSSASSSYTSLVLIYFLVTIL